MLFTGSPRSSAITLRLNAATQATAIHAIRQTILIDYAFYRALQRNNSVAESARGSEARKQCIS